MLDEYSESISYSTPIEQFKFVVVASRKFGTLSINSLRSHRYRFSCIYGSFVHRTIKNGKNAYFRTIYKNIKDYKNYVKNEYDGFHRARTRRHLFVIESSFAYYFINKMGRCDLHIVLEFSETFQYAFAASKQSLEFLKRIDKGLQSLLRNRNTLLNLRKKWWNDKCVRAKDFFIQYQIPTPLSYHQTTNNVENNNLSSQKYKLIGKSLFFKSLIILIQGKSGEKILVPLFIHLFLYIFSL